MKITEIVQMYVMEKALNYAFRDLSSVAYVNIHVTVGKMLIPRGFIFSSS